MGGRQDLQDKTEKANLLLPFRDYSFIDSRKDFSVRGEYSVEGGALLTALESS
jgi:hypothetical protein